jgi:broad specificity phosphatase PhoE
MVESNPAGLSRELDKIPVDEEGDNPILEIELVQRLLLRLAKYSKNNGNGKNGNHANNGNNGAVVDEPTPLNLDKYPKFERAVITLALEWAAAWKDEESRRVARVGLIKLAVESERSVSGFLKKLAEREDKKYVDLYMPLRYLSDIAGDELIRKIKFAEFVKKNAESRGSALNEDVPVATVDENWNTIPALDGKILVHRTTGRIKYASGDPVVKLQFELWMVRHGATDANQQKVFQGVQDEAINQLNVNGKADAARGAEELWAQLGSRLEAGEFVVVRVSPLGRAKETAEVFVKHVPKKYRAQLLIMDDNDAREIDFGVMGNQALDQLDEQYRSIADRYVDGVDATVDFPGGNEENNSFIKLLIRRKAALEKMNKDYAGKSVIVVQFGHGTANAADQILLGNTAMEDDSGQLSWKRDKILKNGAVVRMDKIGGN